MSLTAYHAKLFAHWASHVPASSNGLGEEKKEVSAAIGRSNLHFSQAVGAE